MSYTPPAGDAVTLNLGGLYTPPAGNNVPLNLGSAVGLIEAQLTGTIALSGYLLLGELIETQLTGELALGALVLEYDLNIVRGPSLGTGAPWQASHRQRIETSTPSQTPASLGHGPALSYNAAPALHSDTNSTTQSAPPLRTDTALVWGPADWLAIDTASASENALTRRIETSAVWSEAHRQRLETTSPFQYPARVSSERRAPWQAAESACTSLYAPARSGPRRRQSSALPWQEAIWPRPGVSVPPEPPEPPVEACYIPPTGDAVLLDLIEHLTRYPGDAVPLFITCRRAGGKTVPTRRSYIVLNEFQMVRLPDRLPLPATSCNISIDRDSWCWSVSANLPATYLDELAGTAGVPVEIEVSINGALWRFAVERISRTRQFGKSEIGISGRSLAAYLAAPYTGRTTRTNASAQTAQQLSEAELEFTGWTLDWDLPDWLIPAGAFSLDGTKIDALNAIAASVGGILHAHKTDQQLKFLRNYPILPWDWPTASVDYTLPLSVVTREALQWDDSPAFNAVYVSGTAQGISARVKRTGSAGDVLAPSITDALITHADAARERGLSILGAAGRKAQVTIELPVIPADGLDVLEPGQLIHIDDSAAPWRGLVRSVSVSADQPRVRQSVVLERHY